MSIFDFFLENNPHAAAGKAALDKAQAEGQFSESKAPETEQQRIDRENAERMKAAQEQLVYQQNNPWQPFGAYTPGMLGSMMASWMPGQTASPTLPQNPYAPWADMYWGGKEKPTLPGQAELGTRQGNVSQGPLSQDLGALMAAQSGMMTPSPSSGGGGAPPPAGPPMAPRQMAPAMQPFNPNFLALAMQGARPMPMGNPAPDYQAMYGRTRR